MDLPATQVHDEGGDHLGSLRGPGGRRLTDPNVPWLGRNAPNWSSTTDLDLLCNWFFRRRPVILLRSPNINNLRFMMRISGRCVRSFGDLDYPELDPGAVLGPGTYHAAYPQCMETETARREEVTGFDRLFEARIVVGETVACRRSPVHTLYPGREGFESGVDNREVSDCAVVHTLD
ncbi:uncharacterized protein N7482_002328 [Penicillium canariense]|uniref:Uncharacterized protein n=1 Tax=Penicillium canariense TaxID=189055 RepID=A0A9W9LTX1_9EURO|nr:uncharacterized protein N7482_002328 [Penicillium canariense]KAJ5176451.1 hypothetical protein N7482_002328 [Penicillium canariense]